MRQTKPEDSHKTPDQPREALLDHEQTAEREAIEPTEHDFVESFIDGRGIERKAEHPLVLLDQEAREAIDSYFADHDRLAQASEALLTIYTQAAEVKLDPATPKELCKVDVTQASESLSAASVQISEHPELTQLADEFAKSQQTLVEVPEVPDQASYQQLRELTAGFSPELRDSIRHYHGAPLTLGWHERLLPARRAVFAENLEYALQTIRRSRQTDASIQERKIIEALCADLSRFTPTIERELSALQVVLPENARADMTVYPARTPIENEAAVQQSIQHLTAITELPSRMAQASEAIIRTVENDPAWSVAGNFSEEGQQELNKRITQQIWQKIESRLAEKLQVSNATKHVALQAGGEQLIQLIDTVYQEEALPVCYITESEMAQLQKLIESVVGCGLAKVSTENAAARRIAQAKEAVYNRSESVSEPYFHVSGFMSEIALSGVMLPKQEQIDSKGTLHQQTGLSSGTEGEAVTTTHSSVPHFSKKIQLNYALRSTEHPDSIPGVVALPLGEIIKQAPIDTFASRLKVLPAAKGISRPHSTSVRLAPDGYDIDDDYVFYCDAEYDRSDDYQIPTKKGAIVLIAPDPSSVPPELREQVVVVGKATDIPSAMSQQLEKISHQFSGELVVPLRQEATSFEAESPQASRRPRGKRDAFRQLDTTNLRSTKSASRSIY